MLTSFSGSSFDRIEKRATYEDWHYFLPISFVAHADHQLPQYATREDAIHRGKPIHLTIGASGYRSEGLSLRLSVVAGRAAQQSQRGQRARSSRSCSCSPAMVLRSIMGRQWSRGGLKE